MFPPYLIERVYFRTLRIVAGVCGTAILGFNTLPHLFPQKTFTHQNTCIALSERHERLLKETCKIMNVDSRNVILCYTNGFSTHSAGSLGLPNKAIIGLPRNASFCSINDIKSANILMKDKPIDWDSSLGKSFAEVMLFSDEHIKFLIGHELTHIKQWDFVTTTAHSFGCFYGFYKAGIMIPRFLKGRPFPHTVLLNVTTWVFGLLVYMTTKEKMHHYQEFRADEESARLGFDYCTGGVSYMKNRLKLNRILRSVHGDKGEAMYSKSGNNLQETSTHPKRTSRLKKLKSILSDYNKNVVNCT